MTKADFQALQNQVRILALNIGLRSAARAMGLSEDRVRNWSSRQKWGLASLPLCQVPSRIATPSDTNAIKATEQILAKYSDRTKLNAAVAADKAFDHFADRPANELGMPATALSAENWVKVADRTHGWTQARQSAANVNVAVQVNLPSAEEIAERRAQHKQLDAITALINT